jgi:hypothetical protein
VVADRSWINPDIDVLADRAAAARFAGLGIRRMS